MSDDVFPPDDYDGDNISWLMTSYGMTFMQAVMALKDCHDAMAILKEWKPEPDPEAR